MKWKGYIALKRGIKYNWRKEFEKKQEYEKLVNNKKRVAQLSEIIYY